MRLFLLVVYLFVSPTLARATYNGAWEGNAEVVSSPIPLPANGTWYYSGVRLATIGPDGQGGWMNAPSQAELWLIDATDPVVLSITDAWVTGDRFEVYLNGNLVLTTPAVPFEQQPEIQPDTPGPVPFQNQTALDSAFAAPRYSSGAVLISSGFHLLNIKDISFPPGAGAAGLGVRLESSTTATEPSSWGKLKSAFR